MANFDEELLDDEDRITGALRIGVVGCRRSASWVSPPHVSLALFSSFLVLYLKSGKLLDVSVVLAS